MSIIQPKVTYNITLFGKTEELTSDQLKERIKDYQQQITLFEDDIRLKNKTINEFSAFIKTANEALEFEKNIKTFSVGSTPKKKTQALNISAHTKELMQRIVSFIENNPHREFTIRTLSAELGASDGRIEGCIRHIRDMRLVKVDHRITIRPDTAKAKGSNWVYFYSAKTKATVPDNPTLPTVENASNIDLGGIKQEELKKRTLDRER